jgi:ADP-ribosyl-[dinitrogen reductase] hydrolase
LFARSTGWRLIGQRLVEFRSPQEIRRQYPLGIRQVKDGGIWGTLAGQPTEDSQMALILARTLIKQRRYIAEEARKAYVFWMNSAPLDCGSTVSSGLRGRPNRESQANGASMRISPLGIFGCNYDLDRVSEYARADASLTHPHPVCLQANALFAMAVANAIATWKGAENSVGRLGTGSGHERRCSIDEGDC